MSRAAGPLYAAALLLLLTLPGVAQGVVVASSDPVVTINSTFTGQTITLFGGIEPGQGDVPADGPYELILVVRGPGSDRLIRGKERQLGLILNTGKATYRNLPSYYAILSSKPLADMLDAELENDAILSLQGLAQTTRLEADQGSLDAELIRLMRADGLFVHNERGVRFLSPTTFSARIDFPSSVPNGLYRIDLRVLSAANTVATASTSVVVRTDGFERFLSRAATTHPLLYGFAAVLLAIATGWLGGVVFRR